jgi:ribosomal-protein-alanine N-acetyltransferase
MAHQPILETERLRLRPFTMADAPTVQLLAGAREVAATTINIPFPYADGMAESWITTHPDLWRQGRGVICAIDSVAEVRLIGATGLRIDVGQRRAELGYWIGRHWWGRGYATEASRALVAWAFERLGLQRIFARHFASNPASGRVLEKIGMRREGVLRRHVIKWGRFEDIVLYGVLADEFTP